MTKLTARPAHRRLLESVKTAFPLLVGLRSAEQLVVVARAPKVEVLCLVVKVKLFTAVLELEVTWNTFLLKLRRTLECHPNLFRKTGP